MDEVGQIKKNNHALVWKWLNSFTNSCLNKLTLKRLWLFWYISKFMAKPDFFNVLL